jgi:glucose-6-phosphate 1-epimerase
LSDIFHDNGLNTDLFGGQVLQASLHGSDLFYLAPRNLHVTGQPRRGGVPVLFPQFNNDGDFPKHGFARVMNWLPQLQPELQAQLHPKTSDKAHAPQEASKRWMASMTASAQKVAPYLSGGTALWPHSAELVLDASLQDNSFSISLSVTNTGATEFSFTGGLHPYFVWPEGDIEIEQLGVRLSRELMMEDGAGIEEKFLHRSDRLTVLSADHKMTIKKFGFDEWMLWNPGPRHSIRDIEFADWRSFYCLEPISSSIPISLKAGETFTGGFSIRIDPR